ncbi:hypothetical protein [Paenibacillus sp. 1P07SE]|uniref:hypothetical protein n=1 Tax=Paenibacillus sp. 1P07SE TaxID=3132209 RepID=UPI0039A4AFAC
MVHSARSISRTEYASRVSPVMPYATYPQQYEESLISPFNSNSYFGKGTWARTLRSAADSVREWREASDQMLQELHSFLHAHTSPWKERQLSSSSDSCLAGSVSRGAQLHTYTIHIVSPARTESICSYDLAQDGISIAEPGRHIFEAVVGEHTTRLTIDVNAADTNGHILAKLQQTIRQADIGLDVDILADSARELLALEVKAAHSFRLSDAHGSIIAAIGAGRRSLAAEHARVQIDGGPIQEARGSELILDAGRVKLQLAASAEQPITVRVAQDTDAIVIRIQSLMDRLRPLVCLETEVTESLNPELRLRLESVMSDPAYAQLGFLRKEDSSWSLDEATLRAALAADPGKVERELGGPYGWAARMEQMLRQLSELPAREMMNPADHLMHQFTLYEASMQAYWHMPHSGWMINEQA